MELYSKKVYELSKESENDGLDGSLFYLNTKEKEFLAFLLKKRLYEFTPIEVSKMLGVTNKTIINRCAKLVNNGLLIPISNNAVYFLIKKLKKYDRKTVIMLLPLKTTLRATSMRNFH